MTTEIKKLPARSEVDEALTWNLDDLGYKDETIWESELESLKQFPARLAAFKGRLGESTQTILEYLNLNSELTLLLNRLGSYAQLRFAQDKKNAKYEAMIGRFSAALPALSQSAAFYEGEILSINWDRLESFMSSSPELAIYRHHFEDIHRSGEHIRSAEVEEVLGLHAEVDAGPSQVYEQLSDVELGLGEVPLDGVPQQLTQANFGEIFLQSNDRETRRQAFDEMFGAVHKRRGTFAANYAAAVRQNVFRARVGRYHSAIEKALFKDNIPLAVYHNLIAVVHKNQPLLDRYLRLRKRLLAVEELHWYDLYVPLLKDVQYKINWEEGKQIVLAALAPLGEEYLSVVRKLFAERWIDVVENENKHSGAFSGGQPGTKPYLLINWQGTLASLFTLIHEIGHSVHSWYSRLKQPLVYANYSIFVAETASISNEQLLADYLLKREKDAKVRLYIINKMIENIRQTMCRQTLFAEFERETHARAEAGKSLTADDLSAIHLELNQRYYGAVCVIDPLLGEEWARIPHFYWAFYVYMYAVGVAAAMALVSKIIDEGAPAVARHRAFLEAGSSDYPMAVQKKAGVDLSTTEPFQATFDAFASYLDLLESEIAKL